MVSGRAPAKRSSGPVRKSKTAVKAKTAVRAKAPRKTSAPGVVKSTVAKSKKKETPQSSGVLGVINRALDDMKAVNVVVLDVRELTDITDTMVIASGTSDRHVRSLADRVIEYAKKAGHRPAGIEGERDGEWVLVDLHEAIVHIMLPRIREFYRLENLWDVSAARRAAAAQSDLAEGELDSQHAR